MAHVQSWRFPFETPHYQLDLHCLADWQLGSSSCLTWKIDQWIDDMVEQARFYRQFMPWAKTAAVFAGDAEDNDRPSTREIRARVAAERPEVAEADSKNYIHVLETEVLPRLLKVHQELDYGILGGVAGHHWTFLHGGAPVGDKTVYTSVEYLYARLEQITGKPCVYLGPMVSFLDFRFEKLVSSSNSKTVQVMGLLQHGEGGGQTKGSTLTKLERTAQGFDAEFFIRGHDCQLLATKTDQLYATEGRKKDGAGDQDGVIRSRTKAMLNLGSATMGYEMSKGRSSYIEQSMLRPTTQGGGILRFRVGRASQYEDPNRNYRVRLNIEI